MTIEICFTIPGVAYLVNKNEFSYVLCQSTNRLYHLISLDVEELNEL